MSFQGTLDLFGLADLLRMLASTGKQGGLELRHDGATGGVWLVDGGVAWASSRPGPAPLARRLRGLGAVDQDTLDEAVRHASAGRSLTAALLEAGAVGAERLDQIAREHVVDELFDLARWSEGSFRFEQGEAPPEALDPPATVEELLAETERRLAAWPEIAGRVPGRAARLSLPPAPPSDAGQVTVGADEWRFLAAVGGSRTVADLVDQAGQGEFRTCQALAAMVGRGLLAVTDDPGQDTPEQPGAPAAAGAPDGQTEDPAAAGAPVGETEDAVAAVEPDGQAGAGEAEEVGGAEPSPGGDAAGPAAAPGLGTGPDAEALLDQLIAGVRGL
jgi:hypothetical protein